MTDTASDALRRARLLEEACDFVGAARAALEGGDARLAARLAALGQDEVSFADAERMLCASPQTLSLTANDLASRGLHTFAGRLFELGKEDLRAGESFAAAGDPARAALAFERALAVVAAVASQALWVTDREAPPALEPLLEQIRADVPPVDDVAHRTLGHDCGRLAEAFRARLHASLTAP